MPAGMKSISASEAAGENTPHLDMSDFKAKSPRALRQGEIAPRSPSIKDELEARSESNS